MKLLYYVFFHFWINYIVTYCCINIITLLYVSIHVYYSNVNFNEINITI